MRQKEIWKDIRGYTGLYQVSNMGKIRGLARYSNHRYGRRRVPAKMLKFGKNEFGYVIVMLSKNNHLRCLRVARLVAKAFIPNPFNLPEVNHKKGIKKDNRASQLEWVTKGINMQHSWDIGLRKSKKGCKYKKAA